MIDSSGNSNNYYDPMRLKKAKPKTIKSTFVPHAVNNYDEDMHSADYRGD